MPGTITLDYNNPASYHGIMGIPEHTYSYHYDPRVYVDTNNLVINGMCVEEYLLSLLHNPMFNKEFRRLLTKNLEIE